MHGMTFRFVYTFSVLSALLLSGVAHAAPETAPDRTGEAVSRRFEAIRHDPAALSVFLRAFPKGADLHNHLVGAIPAEHLLEWADQDQRCVNPDTGAITATRCRFGFHPARDADPVQTVMADPKLAARTIDALSTRDFVPTADDRSLHDHFFATFDKFLPATVGRDADMLVDALTQARRDHVTYVELMVSPQLLEAARLGASSTIRDEAGMTVALGRITPHLSHLVKLAREETDRMEHGARQKMQCGTPQASPGCQVAVRYLWQSVRIMPPGMVFSQLAFGYALAQADARFVGLNIVGAEDNPIAMRDYALHMDMFHVLSERWPHVKLSLHAGELSEGLVPPEGLLSHIRQAVDVAGARRIGHGVDIMQETDPYGLLTEMAKRNVLVEINLTSNEQILGVKGADHPFPVFRAHGVPVALSTDDEGVLRSTLTDEYIHATTRYGLSYTDLRDLSRMGLEHAFVPGDSLWASVSPFTIADACIDRVPGDAPTDGACHDLLSHSEKARLQWKLEADLARFEEAVMKGEVVPQ
ncbi:adenosine deaminase family protein [Acetobacter estunensis]|nr:adenosine deaminase [Acetobacter estunensis]